MPATVRSAPAPAREGRPALRVLPGGALRRERRRRLLRAAAGLAVAVVAVAVLAVTHRLAGAAHDARTVDAAGTVVVAPGETLWDVAVTHAPEGSDPRAYLEDLRHLNGVDVGVEPWTVVELPAG